VECGEPVMIKVSVMYHNRPANERSET